ncbi:MAG: hypothetical protein WAL63_05760 [Solirubrobacteraceae bacterium]
MNDTIMRTDEQDGTEPDVTGDPPPAQVEAATALIAGTPSGGAVVAGAVAEAAFGKPAAPARAADRPDPSSSVGTIAGLAELKGLLMYAAILSFASLYVYFIVRILSAPASHPPGLDAAMVTTAAALAGILGSAFALEIGVPTNPAATNPEPRRALAEASTTSKKLTARLRILLSLEPSDTTTRSWPKSFGIWAYAVVGSAVAIAYITNQSETPSAVKALAVAFAGYVLALVRTAYTVK